MGTVFPVDPYNLQTGVKTEDELTSLRQRRKGKKGKQLEKYHRNQNDVCHTAFVSRTVNNVTLSS